MKGDSYSVGAMTAAYSLRLAGAEHDLVCRVTPDVSADCRRIMRHVFTHVVEVPYLSYPVKPLRTQKQRAMYDQWVEMSFTKWNMLSLTQYEKTLFIDADKIVLANLDHLFTELAAPAGTFSSPWSQPFVERKDAAAARRARAGVVASSQPRNSRYASANGGGGRGMPNPYSRCSVHGARVTSGAVWSALTSLQSFVVIGTMVLLSPNDEDLAQYKLMLQQMQPFGFEDCHSMMDEQSLSYYFAIHKNQLIRDGLYGKLTATPGAAAAAAPSETTSSDAASDASASAAPAAAVSSSQSDAAAVAPAPMLIDGEEHANSNGQSSNGAEVAASAVLPAASAGTSATEAASSTAGAAATASSPPAPALPADAYSEWSYIHHRYNYVPWHRYWLLPGDDEVPYTFHFFNTKPWVLERALFLDLEAWWEVVGVMLRDESLLPTEEARDEMRRQFPNKLLSMPSTPGCAWCRMTAELEPPGPDSPAWKDHNVFDAQGHISCPSLRAGFERDQERRRNAAAQPRR
jgi:hypothetical protein